MVGSVGLAVYSTQAGLLTIPEPIMERISSEVERIPDVLNETVDFTRSEPARDSLSHAAMVSKFEATTSMEKLRPQRPGAATSATCLP